MNERLRPRNMSKSVHSSEMPNIETTSQSTELSLGARRLLTGVGTPVDAPYPFADQVLKRQKRKHESIRGSEARIVRSAGSSNYTGIVPLFCLERATKAFESLIEKDFWIVLDFMMRDVVDAKAQPGAIEIVVGSKTERWYPDMWIRRHGRRDLLVECKPAAIVHPASCSHPAEALYMERRIAAMEEAANGMGMDFALFTELEIRTEPRLHNAKTMRRALSAQLPTDLLREAAALLPSLPSIMTVRQFSHEIGRYAGAAMAIACCLDRSGAIELDAGSYFLPETSFRNRKAVE